MDALLDVGKWLWETLGSNVLWALLVVVAGGLLTWWRRHARKNLYLPVILTDSTDFRKNVENTAKQFFAHRQRPVPRLSATSPGSACIVVGGPAVLYSPQHWMALLREVLTTVRKADDPGVASKREQLHVVLGTPSLWSFAFGTALKNRHPLLLYHFQQHPSRADYHRIWRVDRRVKDLRSPKGGRRMEHRFLKPCHPSTPPNDDPASTECLVFEIGANEISDSVRSYRDQHLPGATMRVFGKVRDLDPRNPEQWIRAAAELAHAVCDRQASLAQNTYLFMDMPTVLALMVGDAIGDYLPRRLHLMQYDKHQQTYHEVLQLPDPELSKLAG